MRAIMSAGLIGLAAGMLHHGVTEAKINIERAPYESQDGERLRLADAKRARKSEKLRRDFSNHTGE